jgi:hypothetical protein
MKTAVRIGAILGAVVLLAPAARAVDKDKIQGAVDRGVAYLKGIQGPDGTWRCTDQNVGGDTTAGATALCGVALLESGVKPDDPAVQKAARAVREQSVGLTKTYALALAIMFLDRLGDPADAQLIQSMAVRLLAGQDPSSGGWSYECPPPSDGEVHRLQGALKQRNELVARPAPPEAPKGRLTEEDLPKEIRQQLRLINQQAGRLTAQGTDNSNTQFAVLALWIARRKGIPVETALHRIETRYRTSQQGDGGWGYMPQSAGTPPGALPSGPSMTCAGLLGLALGHGGAMEATLHTGPGGAGARGGPARDISKDPVVRKGLVALGGAIGRPLEELGKPLSGGLAGAGPMPGFGPQPRGGPPPGAPQNTNKAYYFLFSLERVAVAYGLETIGNKDWYNWGADLLLHNQNNDGSWTGQFAQAGSDTCFALLFLRRANLAQDLTATLKGQVKDPGERVLHSIDIDGDKGGPDKGGPDKGGPKASRDNDTATAGPPKETRPAIAPVDPEVSRLSEELVKADAGRQEQVLEKLRDSKGGVYTDALAHAIHRLYGPVKGKAREALTDRLSRMKSTTLSDKLQDDDAEVRRAAALACAMKDEKAHIPRLIEMLQDPELDVARAAHATLKVLTGNDFGPGKDANRFDFSRSADAWKEWWSKKGDK